MKKRTPKIDVVRGSVLIHEAKDAKELDKIKASLKLYIESNGDKRECPYCGSRFQNFRALGIQCCKCHRILSNDLVNDVMLLLAQDEIKFSGAAIVSSKYQAILRKYRII